MNRQQKLDELNKRQNTKLDVAQSNQEQLKQSVDHFATVLEAGIELKDADKILDSLKSIEKLQPFIEQFEQSIKSINYPTQLTIKDLPQLLKALDKPDKQLDLKPIQQVAKNLDNLSKAIKDVKAPTQKQQPSDYLPMRRVVNIKGVGFMFDDSFYTGGGGGGGIDADLKRNSGTSISVVNPDGTNIAGGSGGGDASASNQTNGNQKSQLVDAGGEAATVTGGKLDVNASIDTTGLATSAKQDTGNTSLASIDGKDFATQTTLALIKAKTDNIDVALSTRTKPADQQHVIVDSGVTTGLTDTQLRATPVPISGTVTANLGTLNGAATSAKQDTGNTSVASIDTKTPALGQALAAASVPIVLTASQITTLTPQTNALTDTQLRATPVPVSGTVAVTGAGDASAANQVITNTEIGIVTETAPATDIASSGLNGRLQRIAQRLTSIIALLPGSLGQKARAASLAVTLSSEDITALTPLSTVAVTQSTSPWVTSNATTSVVGNGVAATAQRVTLANDSTGVIATVGAVTAITNALPAGNNNIGDVDVVTLPVAFNAGAASATTQRVVVATDQTVIPISDNSGSLTVDQPTGTNLHTVVDSGTITAVTGITNALPAGTNNIGKVTEIRADTSPATANITTQDLVSVSTAGMNSQSLITGTPTANSAASFTLSGQNTINTQITGVWTGTLASEVSFDGGTTWFTRGLHQIGTNYNVGSFTSNGQGVGEVSGATNYRVRATAAVTGTATITVTESLNPASFYIINTPQLADGTTPTQKLAIDSSGQAATVARKKSGTTTTPINISTSTTVATLYAANTSRIKVTVINNSTTGILYVKEGAAATSTSHTYALNPATATASGGTAIIDDSTAIITGILSTGTGTATGGETA